jgi:inorganic phosphate transporter, PiT family
MQGVMTALLALAAFFLAYANGSNDNFKGVATLYGSGASDRRGALRLANAATFAGALTALALAGALALKFGGRGLLADVVTQTTGFPLAVAAAAAGTVLLATRFGLPISTTHALLGALLGAGLAVEPAAVLWGGLGSYFIKPLLLSPLLAVAAIAIVYPLLHRARLGLGIEKDSCACVAPCLALAGLVQRTPRRMCHPL